MNKKLLEELFAVLEKIVEAPGIPWAVKAEMIKTYAVGNPEHEVNLQEFLSWFDEAEE